MMKKDSVYKILIIVLIVVNLLQLGVHFIHSNSVAKLTDGTTFRQSASQLLQLSRAQEQPFYQLARTHKDEIIALQKQRNARIKSYFQEPTAALLDDIAAITTQQIKLTEAHFNSVYHLLRTDQQANFSAFITAALQRITQ